MLDLSERDWQKVVLGIFRMYRWRTAHFDASVRVVGKERRFVGDKGAKGFPDIVAVREKRLIFAELKSERGRYADGQKEWLEGLATSGAEVYTWRPSEIDAVKNILK